MVAIRSVHGSGSADAPCDRAQTKRRSSAARAHLPPYRSHVRLRLVGNETRAAVVSPTMRRTTRGLLEFVGLQLLVGCGGQTPASEEHPVDGFYEVTTVTRNDTCSPATQQGISQEGIQGTSAVVALNLWSGLRQEVPWTDGEPLEKWRCDSTEVMRTEPIFRAEYQLSDLTAHSFKAESTMTWNDPTACPVSAPVILPSAPCSVERTQTFQLIAACPAKLGNVGCPDPRQ